MINLNQEITPVKARLKDKPANIEEIRECRRVLKDGHRGQDFNSRIYWKDYFVAIHVPITTASGSDSNLGRGEGTRLIGLT